MAALYSRLASHDDHLIRSQESHILLGFQEIEQTTGKMVTLYLSEFDVKLVHTPGNKMVQSDTLSQWPDLCPNDSTDNDNMIMLYQ